MIRDTHFLTAEPHSEKPTFSLLRKFMGVPDHATNFASDEIRTPRAGHFLYANAGTCRMGRYCIRHDHLANQPLPYFTYWEQMLLPFEAAGERSRQIPQIFPIFQRQSSIDQHEYRV